MIVKIDGVEVRVPDDATVEEIDALTAPKPESTTTKVAKAINETAAKGMEKLMQGYQNTPLGAITSNISRNSPAIQAIQGGLAKGTQVIGSLPTSLIAEATPLGEGVPFGDTSGYLKKAGVNPELSKTLAPIAEMAGSMGAGVAAKPVISAISSIPKAAYGATLSKFDKAIKMNMRGSADKALSEYPAASEYLWNKKISNLETQLDRPQLKGFMNEEAKKRAAAVDTLYTPATIEDKSIALLPEGKGTVEYKILKPSIGDEISMEKMANRAIEEPMAELKTRVESNYASPYDITDLEAKKEAAVMKGNLEPREALKEKTKYSKEANKIYKNTDTPIKDEAQKFAANISGEIDTSLMNKLNPEERAIYKKANEQYGMLATIKKIKDMATLAPDEAAKLSINDQALLGIGSKLGLARAGAKKLLSGNIVRKGALFLDQPVTEFGKGIETAIKYSPAISRSQDTKKR